MLTKHILYIWNHNINLYRKQSNQWSCLLKPVKLKLECQAYQQTLSLCLKSLETTALKPHIVSIISPKPHFHSSIKLPFCYKNKARAITRPTKISGPTPFFFYFNWSYLLYNIVVVFAIHWHASAILHTYVHDVF